MGLKRNLTMGEIVAQVIQTKLLIRADINHGDYPGQEIIAPPSSTRYSQKQSKLTNLVLMGMGEPFDNADNVLKSLQLITSPEYLAIANKHVTVSTVGVIPQLEHLIENGGLKCGLTISLGSVDDKIRSSIMPCNKAWPLSRLKEVLTAYPLPHGQRLTFAYVLLKDVNDSPDQALALSKFLTGLKTKINLIPFNPWPGAPYQRPSKEKIISFHDILSQKYHTVLIRDTKGSSINAACGLLVASQIPHASQPEIHTL
jgi:23S rRNA (adenine2503-C2)-methyltransferase